MTVASATKETPEKSGTSPSRSSTPASESSSETSSVHSGDASDRRDVDIMTQVLSSRSEEYRLLFRLPPDEVLVQDYNCALQENILLQGHMYLFIHHICFYSNIFGFETKKTIPFHEVTCVRKAKTAAIFPNAIEIVTGERKHFFGSFLSRDEAYRLIVDSWAQHNSDVKALLERQESKSESGQDIGFVVVESIAGPALLTDTLSSADRIKDNNGSEECSSLLNGENNIETLGQISAYQENGMDENIDPSSSRESLIWNIEDLDAPKIPENFALVIEAKFPVSVEEFFTLYISDDASEFLKKFHHRCGDKEFQCSPWRQGEQFGHARDLCFLHPVKVYIGAKLGRCQEIQKYRVYKDSHLVIETSQQISDVPFADYFHVERILDVAKDGNEGSSCNFRVYFRVAFSKKTMFKGKIEQSTRDELREVHGIWISSAHELLKQKVLAKQKGTDCQDQQIQDGNVEISSRAEELDEHRHAAVSASKVSPILPVDNSNAQSRNQDKSTLESPVYSAQLASFFSELRSTLLSYMKSQSHLPLYLAMAIVSILILMQVSIIVMLTRVPQVHVVTQPTQISSLSDYRAENIGWLEKRVDYLKEEMLMVEAQLDRMRHEHSLLMSHLVSLERLKPKS